MLRRVLGPKVNVVCLCDRPGLDNILATSCFSLKYKDGMSLESIRKAGFKGRVRKVLFDYGSRMTGAYFQTAFPNVLAIFQLLRSEVDPECEVIFEKTDNTKELLQCQKAKFTYLAGLNEMEVDSGKCELVVATNQWLREKEIICSVYTPPLTFYCISSVV